MGQLTNLLNNKEAFEEAYEAFDEATSEREKRFYGRVFDWIFDSALPLYIRGKGLPYESFPGPRHEAAMVWLNFISEFYGTDYWHEAVEVVKNNYPEEF